MKKVKKVKKVMDFSGRGRGIFAYPWGVQRKVNVKINSEAHAELRLIAVRCGVSVDDARDEALRIGIAKMSRRKAMRGKRMTMGG